MEKIQDVNINDLPNELLCRIFLSTKPEDWVYSIPYVCEKWKRAMPSVWQQVCHLEYEGTITYKLTLNDGRILPMSSRNFTSNDDVDDKNQKVDDADLAFLIDICAHSLKSLTLYIPQSPSWIKEETILLIGAACKNLLSLTLSGDVSSLADSLTVACQDLPSLEEIIISDESYQSDSDQFNVATLVGDILSSCRNLRVVEGNFSFVDAPSINVFRRLEGLNLEKLSWIAWQATSPGYVEDMLSTLTKCSNNLRDLQLLCEVTGPLNGAICNRCLNNLGDEKVIEVLNLGFQLLLPSLTEDDEDPVEQGVYDRVDEAPWTDDFIISLPHFVHLRQLTLQSFDFSKPSVLEMLQQVAPQLTLLRLEDNYNVTENFFYSWRVKLPNLQKLTLMRGHMSHVCLTEFVLLCPKLTSFVVSNIKDLSFKDLVLSLHEYLHNCTRLKSKTKDLKNIDSAAPSLYVRLDTAPSFRHNEAKELKNIHLCGLKTVGSYHSRVEISRTCKNEESVNNQH